MYLLGFNVAKRTAFLLFVLGIAGCSNTDTQKQLSYIETAMAQAPFTVQVLGINDFHGQILAKNEQGGLYNLGAHLISAIDTSDEHTFILHAGDHVGASPAESALLQDEPAISFLNKLTDYCVEHKHEKCKVIGTAGNHEFDEGSSEMLRLLKGGNHVKGPFLESSWQGAKYKTLSANVVDNNSNNLLLPPYVVHQVNGVDIGFIGLTLDTTPELVIPGAVDDLTFKDQAEVAQYYVSVLEKKGVEAIVIIVHDGSDGKYYATPTRRSAGIDKDTEFGQFLAKLPNSVDLVVSGHSHQFTNAYFPRKNAPALLVTQAYSSGRAYADISLTVDPSTGDISDASAVVIMANSAPLETISELGKSTLKGFKQLIKEAVSYAQSYTDRPISTYQPIENQNKLGQFIANSHQYHLQSDLAVMNVGGVRAEIKPGVVTWGDLFAVQPFSNQLVVREFSGEQLVTLFDSSQYWSKGLAYTTKGDLLVNGKKVLPMQMYTVGGNAYIMNSTKFQVGKLVRIEGLDNDATVEFIQKLGSPFNLSSTIE